MPLQGRFLGRVVIGLGLLAWTVQPASADTGRVISVGGSVTEIVYALGAGSKLVAVDQTSLHPPEAQDLPDVGYLRALSAEPILSLAPDLVLVEAETVTHAVVSHPPRRLVLKAGRIVARDGKAVQEAP